MQHQYPPSIEAVEKEIALHLGKNIELAPAYALYKEIFTIQKRYLELLDVSCNLPSEAIKEFFRNGKYLISEQKPHIDNQLFRELLESIAVAILHVSPKTPPGLKDLAALEEFNIYDIQEFIQQVMLFDKYEMEEIISAKGMDKRASLDREIIAFVIFMSLSPFFTSIMQKAEKQCGFSLWRQGYCPVCGQIAVLAKHRSEDGARMLECWLCHAQWVFPRLECPYCKNKDQKKLRFFYFPHDWSRQVHVCEECKSYLKTVDEKSMQKDVILEIEAIATGQLDMFAEKEGYKPPARAPLLH